MKIFKRLHYISTSVPHYISTSLYQYIIICFLLAGCTKTDDGLSKKICLTFEGTLTNYFDNSPVKGEYVYIAYGKPCCGGIESVIGLDSVKSDKAGHYKIEVSHTRDTIQYAYIAFIKGHTLRFRPLPTPAYDLQDWITYDFTGYNIVPEIPTDIIDEEEIHQTNLLLIPAGIIALQAGADLVPPGDTLYLTLTSPGVTSPFDGNPILSGFGFVGDGTAYNRDIPAVGGRDNILTTEIRRVGGEVVSYSDTLTVAQGERKVYGF